MSTLMWTAASAGTMTDLSERLLYGARANLHGNAITIYWTDDATATGTNLFSDSYMPWVEVIAADPSGQQAWTTDAHWGPMMRSDFMGGMPPFCWETKWDSTNSIWYTEIAGGVTPNSNTTISLAEGQRTGGGARVSKRPVFVYAMGTTAEAG